MAKGSKVANIQQLQRVQTRPGEGSTIGYVLKHSAQTDGSTTLSFSLNLNTARVPDRRYMANAAAVIHDRDRVNIVFGQSKLGGGGYRSLVLIDMYGSSVHLLCRSSRKMLGGAAKYVTDHKLAQMGLTAIREDVPGQTVPFTSNIASGGFTAGDACMDFYYASPFAFQIAGVGGEFQAEPLVRVALPTPLMLSVYSKLEELLESLPEERPHGDDESEGS